MYFQGPIGIICGVYRCDRDKTRKEKMMLFPESCWEMGREKSGAVHSASWLTGSTNDALHSGVFSSVPRKCIILNQLTNLNLHISKKGVPTFTNFRNDEA